MLIMPAEEFLEFFRGILNKTEKAKIKRDVLITKIIKNINIYNNKKRIIAENKRKKDEFEAKTKKYQEDLKKWEEKQKLKQSQPKPKKVEKTPEIESEPDYANMRQKDLHELQGQAIDSGNYQLAAKIAQFIK
jgi:hypothetical protein